MPQYLFSLLTGLSCGKQSELGLRNKIIQNHTQDIRRSIHDFSIFAPLIDKFSSLPVFYLETDCHSPRLSPSPSCFQGQSPILESLSLRIFPFNLSLFLPLADFLLIFHWDHSNCNLIHFPLQLIHFELTNLFLIILLLNLKQFKYLTYKFTSHFTILFIFASVSLFSSLFPKITLK